MTFEPDDQVTLSQPLKIIGEPCLVALRMDIVPEVGEMRHKWRMTSVQESTTECEHPLGPPELSTRVWGAKVDPHRRHPLRHHAWILRRNLPRALGVNQEAGPHLRGSCSP